MSKAGIMEQEHPEASAKNQPDCSETAQVASTKEKTTRDPYKKRLDNQTRVSIIQLALSTGEDGKEISTKAVADQFGVTVKDVINAKNSKLAEKIATGQPVVLKSEGKTSRQQQYPLLREVLVLFLERRLRFQAVTGVIVSFAEVYSFAINGAMRLADFGHDEYKTFKVRTDWVSRFLRDHGYKNKSFHGESGQIQASEAFASESAKAVRDIVWARIPANVPLCNIFNMDEGPVLKNQIPSRGIAKIGEPAHGTKQMTAKERVTCVICVGADGSKLPLTVIGKSKNPKSFQGWQIPEGITYVNQANAWMDSIG